MITNKDILLESPLNSKININDTLLLNLNYKEKKEDNNTITRDSIYLIKKKESIFNKIIKNNCLEEEELFKLPVKDNYKEVILNRIESQDEGKEDLDILIENMMQKNKRIEKQIMKLNKEIIVIKSVLPNDYVNNDDPDIRLLNETNEILQQFIIDKNLNL